MNKNVLKYYGYQFFSNLDFARGLFVIYITGKGLSGSQIGLIQTILFTSSLLFEVPAGMFADKFSKKISIVLGLLICAIVPILIFINNNPFYYYLIFFALGLGYSLERGADVALLFERLQADGEVWVVKFKEILGKARFVRYGSLALAISIGGTIQKFGWISVFLLVSFCMLLAAIFVFSFEEVKKSDRRSIDNKGYSLFLSMQHLIATMRKFLSTTKGRMLIYLTFVMAFVQASTTPLFIYSQLLFKNYGLSNQYIGFIISGGLISTSLASVFAHRLKFQSEIKLCFSLVILLIITLMIFLLKPNIIVGVLVFILSQAIPSILLIHLSEIFNLELPEDIRTTSLSLQNFIGALILVMTNLVFGKLIDVTSIYIAIGSFSILPIISILFLFLYRNAKLKSY